METSEILAIPWATTRVAPTNPETQSPYKKHRRKLVELPPMKILIRQEPLCIHPRLSRRQTPLRFRYFDVHQRYVHTAFRFGRARPAARAFVGAGRCRPGAGPTADA